MKKLIFFGISFVLVCLYACSVNNAGDPKNVAKAFYEALANKDYEKAAQLATKDSKTLIDLLKSLSQLGNQPGTIFNEEGDEKIKTAVYSDAIIDGDRATVKVTIDNEEKQIKLKKEEGAWKVALDKDAINNSVHEEIRINSEDVNASMDEAMRKMEEIPMDSIQNAINKASELIKSDTMKNVLKKAGEIMKKAGETMEQAGKQSNQ
jgi:DNA-directed RNA polymerase specialized sigma54-like protein